VGNFVCVCVWVYIHVQLKLKMDRATDVVCTKLAMDRVPHLLKMYCTCIANVLHTHMTCLMHMFDVLCTYSMSQAHIPCLMHIFHVSCTYSMSHAHIRTYIYTHSHTNAPTHTNTNTPTAMPTNTHAFALKYSCIHLNTPCIHLSTQTCKRPLIHTYTHILNTHRLKTHI